MNYHISESWTNKLQDLILAHTGYSLQSKITVDFERLGDDVWETSLTLYVFYNKVFVNFQEKDEETSNRTIMTVTATYDHNTSIQTFKALL